MDKLNKQQLSGIAELVHYINDRDVIQCILEKLGKENWTKAILTNCSFCLTPEQEEVLESLGGYYTSEEIDEIVDNHITNLDIAEKLKEQGVIHYLYENEEYLDEIREGKIICEGIDVEKIKNMIYE